MTEQGDDAYRKTQLNIISLKKGGKPNEEKDF